jgi:MFS family permease
LPSAIAMNSIAWQAGAIVGPLLGGAAYALTPSLPYEASTVLYAISLGCMLLIRPIPRGNAAASRPLRAVIEGLAYVRDNKIVLGAISLDLFAVLLGGATAMLPVYARDILHVGSEGLGALRAAPAVGAALTALVLARVPMKRNVGIKMFLCVGLFGLATMVFGESKWMGLSLLALFVIGASDMISVYVRSSLIQLHTPDAMRGRVSAVSGLFISASNELGEFRAGVAGAAFGPVLAVVGGGALSVLATAFCAWAFPSLRKADRFVPPDAPILADSAGKDQPDVECPPLVAGHETQPTPLRTSS